MARIARVAPGDTIYHVLNRGNGRRTIFHKDADARAFVGLAEVKRRVSVRVLGYCVMGNHWHAVLWPHADGDLSRFVARLTTHVRAGNARPPAGDI